MDTTEYQGSVHDKTIRVRIFTDKYGRRTCVKDIKAGQACAFYWNLGFCEICIVGDIKHHSYVKLKRHNRVTGSCKPFPNCPIWKDVPYNQEQEPW